MKYSGFYRHFKNMNVFWFAVLRQIQKGNYPYTWIARLFVIRLSHFGYFEYPNVKQLPFLGKYLHMKCLRIMAKFIYANKRKWFCEDHKTIENAKQHIMAISDDKTPLEWILYDDVDYLNLLFWDKIVLKLKKEFI